MSPFVPKLGCMDGIKQFLSKVYSDVLFRFGVFCTLLLTVAWYRFTLSEL